MFSIQHALDNTDVTREQMVCFWVNIEYTDGHVHIDRIKNTEHVSKEFKKKKKKQHFRESIKRKDIFAIDKFIFEGLVNMNILK